MSLKKNDRIHIETKCRRRLQATVRVVHQYVGLTVATLWLLQAATGIMLVFHWEIDDMAVRGPARELDPARFEIFLQQLQASNPDRMVSAVYAGGMTGRKPCSWGGRGAGSLVSADCCC